LQFQQLTLTRSDLNAIFLKDLTKLLILLFL
jgi:hypothetical protein